MGEEPQPEIVSADVGQEIFIQRHVLRQHPANQDALAASSRFVQFAAFVRHRRT
jgi:hypothetical protein